MEATCSISCERCWNNYSSSHLRGTTCCYCTPGERGDTHARLSDARMDVYTGSHLVGRFVRYCVHSHLINDIVVQPLISRCHTLLMKLYYIRGHPHRSRQVHLDEAWIQTEDERSIVENWANGVTALFLNQHKSLTQLHSCQLYDTIRSHSGIQGMFPASLNDSVLCHSGMQGMFPIKEKKNTNQKHLEIWGLMHYIWKDFLGLIIHHLWCIYTSKYLF